MAKRGLLLPMPRLTLPVLPKPMLASVVEQSDVAEVGVEGAGVGDAEFP